MILPEKDKPAPSLLSQGQTYLSLGLVFALGTAGYWNVTTMDELKFSIEKVSMKLDHLGDRVASGEDKTVSKDQVMSWIQLLKAENPQMTVTIPEW